jgi:signal peptidase II
MPVVFRGTIRLLIGCVFVFSLDALCKQHFFDQGHSFSFFAGWIQSIEHQNYGIAFNIPIPQWLILGITLAACVGIILFFLRTQNTKNSWLPLFLGILLGGALGNGFDRWSLGFVRDWLLLWHHSAINVADVGVLCGLAGTLYFSQKTLPHKTDAAELSSL